MRSALWIGSFLGALAFFALLLLLPAIGGQITAEQPISQYASAER